MQIKREMTTPDPAVGAAGEQSSDMYIILILTKTGTPDNDFLKKRLSEQREGGYE